MKLKKRLMNLKVDTRKICIMLCLCMCLTLCSCCKRTFTEESAEAINSVQVTLMNSIQSNGWTIITDKNSNDKYAGLTVYRDKTITIYNTYHSDSYTVKDTLFHELGHYVDYITRFRYTRDKKFIALYEKYKANEIEEYGRSDNKEYWLTNERELFAGCYRMYVLHKEVMKKQYTDLYMYFSYEGICEEIL